MAGTVFDFLIEQCKATLGGEPPPPEVIANARDLLSNLGDFSANDPNDLIEWLNRWRSLLQDPLSETLLVRILQLHMPRVAEALTLLGIIDFRPQELPGTGLKSFKVHWTQGDDSRSSVMQFLDPAKSKEIKTWLSFLAGSPGKPSCCTATETPCASPLNGL
jgi:hypothetical protein